MFFPEEAIMRGKWKRRAPALLGGLVLLALPVLALTGLGPRVFGKAGPAPGQAGPVSPGDQGAEDEVLLTDWTFTQAPVNFTLFRRSRIRVRQSLVAHQRQERAETRAFLQSLHDRFLAQSFTARRNSAGQAADQQRAVALLLARHQLIERVRSATPPNPVLLTPTSPRFLQVLEAHPVPF